MDAFSFSLAASRYSASTRVEGKATSTSVPSPGVEVMLNRARFTINSTPGEGTLVEVAFPSTRVLAE